MRIFATVCLIAAAIFGAFLMHWSLVDVGVVRMRDSTYLALLLGVIGWINLCLWTALGSPKNNSHGKT